MFGIQLAVTHSLRERERERDRDRDRDRERQRQRQRQTDRQTDRDRFREREREREIYVNIISGFPEFATNGKFVVVVFTMFKHTE